MYYINIITHILIVRLVWCLKKSVFYDFPIKSLFFFIVTGIIASAFYGGVDACLVRLIKYLLDDGFVQQDQSFLALLPYCLFFFLWYLEISLIKASFGNKPHSWFLNNASHSLSQSIAF